MAAQETLEIYMLFCGKLDPNSVNITTTKVDIKPLAKKVFLRCVSGC